MDFLRALSYNSYIFGRVVKLVYTLVLGTSGVKPVKVRVLSRPPCHAAELCLAMRHAEVKTLKDEKAGGATALRRGRGICQQANIGDQVLYRPPVLFFFVLNHIFQK